jgi:hypothetical protein
VSPVLPWFLTVLFVLTLLSVLFVRKVITSQTIFVFPVNLVARCVSLTLFVLNACTVISYNPIILVWSADSLWLAANYAHLWMCVLIVSTDIIWMSINVFCVLNHWKVVGNVSILPSVRFAIQHITSVHQIYVKSVLRMVVWYVMIHFQLFVSLVGRDITSTVVNVECVT